MSKVIKIYISSDGRKRKYIGTYGKRSSYPVVYFRKSKWATDEEFETIVSHLLDSLEQTTTSTNLEE